jgi:FAM32A
MASSGDYSSVPSTGKLKLKGVKDSKVDKKKKKNKQKPVEDGNGGEFEDKSVMLRKLEDEDEAMRKENHRELDVAGGKEVGSGTMPEDNDIGEMIKTEAEKRYDEQRRKRVSTNPLAMPERRG